MGNRNSQGLWLLCFQLFEPLKELLLDAWDINITDRGILSGGGGGGGEYQDQKKRIRPLHISQNPLVRKT